MRHLERMWIFAIQIPLNRFIIIISAQIFLVLILCWDKSLGRCWFLAHLFDVDYVCVPTCANTQQLLEIFKWNILQSIKYRWDEMGAWGGGGGGGG